MKKKAKDITFKVSAKEHAVELIKKNGDVRARLIAKHCAKVAAPTEHGNFMSMNHWDSVKLNKLYNFWKQVDAILSKEGK